MKTALVFVDHGLTIGYYLFTGLAELLTSKGVRLVFLVEEGLVEKLRKDFASNELLIFESAREDQATEYQRTHLASLQEVFEYIRKSSMSPRVPLTYVDTHRQRKEFEAQGRWKLILKSMRPVIFLLRSSKLARRIFRWVHNRIFAPKIYADLIEKYQPDLIVSSTAGWRQDRFILREGHRRGIPSVMTVIGWDNPSAHGIPGADVDYAIVWSEVHRWELNEGYDWPKDKIMVGGMPLYDGYLKNLWLMPREEYFQLHGLDINKKLIAYAATALSISPNLHIIEELIRVITENQLSVPAQLLIRLHPNHYKSQKHYQEERDKIFEISQNCPDVHVVAPKALAGGLPRYSGEDFPEKASMLAYCDILVTIYSTMVLEAAIKDKPLVSCCIDSPTGWPDNFWIPLHDVPNWPTAARLNKAQAGTNAFTREELVNALEQYLSHPDLHRENRRHFVEQELTYLNGESTKVTAEYLLKLLEL